MYPGNYFGTPNIDNHNSIFVFQCSCDMHSNTEKPILECDYQKVKCQNQLSILKGDKMQCLREY